jgi:outer membrane protein assembly factor BamB
MKIKIISLLLLLIFVHLNSELFASVFFQSADTILNKNINYRNLQRSTSLNGIKIVVPDEPEWNALAKDLQFIIKEKTSLVADISIPDPMKFVKGWAGNTIILGNLGNNKQMARLYGMRLSYADAVYPGKAGYQLSTLIDPFGFGGNTIIIAASDISGAKFGTERLINIIKDQKDFVVPWLLEVNIPVITNDYFNSKIKNEDLLLAAMKPVKENELIADALLAVLAGIKSSGEYYQLSANPEYFNNYKKLLLGYASFVNKYPSESIYQLGVRKNMWIQGEKLLQNWSVIEGSGLFSDSERAKIVSALFLTCKANYLDNYLVRAPERAPRWNHEIFPALSLVGSCNYFEKYYKIPELIKWKNRGDRIFQGNTSFISMDEGSDYLAHLPVANIDYAMLSGDLKFINQSLRPSADLHSMMIDNLGTLSGGGDTYPFGMSSAYSWGHSQLLNAASWYYKDPVYNFLLERTRTGPFPGQKMTDLSYPIHRYIAQKQITQQPDGNQYPKVQAQEIEQGVYDDVKSLIHQNVPEFQEGLKNENLKNLKKDRISVEQNDTFHKLTFRSGFGLNDNYMILDGFSAGKHGHQDGNTILNYSANGRLFLNDRDYIQNTPEYHSGLVIVKDGKQTKKPPLVKLDWVADLEGTSTSRSIVPDYNGLDWERTIISPEGKFFIIYDDLKIRDSGRFLLKNHWQSLGTPKIEDQTFKVEQKGVNMLLQNLSDVDLRMKDIYGHFIKYWKTVYPYPFAEKETVLTEVIDEKKYEIGDHTGFINVLSSHSEEIEAVQTKVISAGVIEIKQGENKWLAVKGLVNSPGFSSNGLFHLIGDKEIISASVTQLKIGSQELNFLKAVFFKLNKKSGQWKAFDLLKDKINYDQSGEPVRQGAIDSGQVQWNDEFVKTLELPSAIAMNKNQITGANSLISIPIKDSNKFYSFNEPVSSSFLADLNGDKKDDILLGGISGKVQAIDSKGKLLWTFSAKGRVNEVSLQYAGNRPLIFIATENWYMYALDINGKELWNYKFPDDAAHREYKGNLIGITNIRIANKNGKDQEPAIMVGSQFRYLYELDLQGKLIDEKPLYFYGIEDMEYADLDADGKEEGVFALEYYYYTLIKDNELTTGKSGGPGWKIAHVLNKESKSIRPTVLLGTKQSEIRMIGFKDKVQEYWVTNVGGEVNDIRDGDFNIDGKLEILAGTEGFQFYVLDDKGNTILRSTLHDRVLKVAGYRQSGKAFYLAATANGLLYKITENGQIVSKIQFPAEIANILVGKAYSEYRIVLTNGELF